jgi:uncharacterized protein (TIGR02145 family)
MKNLISTYIFLAFLLIIPTNNSSAELIDAEGNIYKTVVIGDQEWMAENLRTGLLNDGTQIPYITDDSKWITLNTPAACWYNNDSLSFHSNYGRIYNGYSALDPKICPTHWRVPTVSDWNDMIRSIGGLEVAGGKLKHEGTEYWNEPNTGATNSSGFTALPSGWRSNLDGSFAWLGQRAGWFVINQFNDVEFRWVSWSLESSGSGSIALNAGLCIRCLRDVASTIGDDNLDRAEIRIYPNPASEYIEIKFERWTPSARWSPSEIKIYNAIGELVISVVLHLGDVGYLKRIDVSHLPIGLYFIQIGNYSQKFMVVK